MRWMIGNEASDKLFHSRSTALDLDLHTLQNIANVASQPKRGGQAVDKGSKPNTLHVALYHKALPLHRV